MISYTPLWDILKRKNISTYKLINTYHFSPRTIHKLKHNQNITMNTLERLCVILKCMPNDIVYFLPSEHNI